MPPSADVVVRLGPTILAGMAVPIAALAASSMRETISQAEKEEKDKEALRRAKLVSEMVDILVANENLETGAQVGQLTEVPEGAEECGEDGACAEETASGSRDAGEHATEGNDEVGEATTKSSASATEVGEEEEEDDDGQISYEDLRRRCKELADIAPGVPELEKGIEWCGRLLLKELLRATKKTKSQKDIKYSDGTKLEGLLNCPEELDDLARLARHPVPKDVLADVRGARNEGYQVRRAQQRKDFMKAMRMIFLAKDTMPWVVGSSAMSAISVSIATMALHYRAEVLQTLLQSGAAAASGSAPSFRTATSAMVVVELLAAAARALESQLRARSQDLMAKSIQIKLFQALVSKDMNWWGNQKDPWELIMKVWNLPGQVESALEAPRMLLNRATSISIQAALVRQKSSRMLYAMLSLHWARFLLRKLLGWLQDWSQRRVTRGLVMPSQDKFTWIYALNPEYIRMYQSFARGPIEALDLQKFLRGRNRQAELWGAVSALFGPVHSVVAQAASIAEFSSMEGLVREGSLDVAQAETVMHYASAVGSEVEGTYDTVTGVQGVLSPLAMAYDYIAIPPRIDPAAGLVPPGRAGGHFVFEDVHFRYPGRKVELLKGVSFEVKPGQVVGITGTTGCGKSTCLGLVERFFDPTKGRILLDGRDIREYQPRWLRSQIVAVAQEPKLLPLTIRDNLTFGCDHDPSKEEIEHACRAANIWEALSDPQKFPNGLETQMNVVQNVAGGEKQRLCIARAILANPPILLLDEATSALDEVSQAQVQEALNKLMKGRTTLVIAHRLSTIKDSDKIIAMRDGKVVDDGPHEELLKKEDGVWRQLWMQQGADSPAAEAQRPQPPAKLQRTTTSADGKLAVLRQAVASLAEGDEARAAPALEIIDELVRAARAGPAPGAVEELTAQLPGGRGSRPAQRAARAEWGKLRALRRLGGLSPGAPAREAPKLPRSASLERNRAA